MKSNAKQENPLQSDQHIRGSEMRKDIRIAGFGGQGIILAGIVIGKAAALHDGIYAVQTQSYGPEARGGASRTEVVVSDEEVDYPKVQNPDIFVAMSHTALIAYLDDLKDGGILIVDPDMISEEEVMPFVQKHNIKLYKAPATQNCSRRNRDKNCCQHCYDRGYYKDYQGGIRRSCKGSDS